MSIADDLGRWFGIDVIVHWTFLLLIGLLVAQQFAGSEFPDAVDLDQRGPGRVQPAPSLPDGWRPRSAGRSGDVSPIRRATNIAAACGQVMAVLFGVVGFFTNWMLMLVAFFVYFAARGEAQHVQMRSLVRRAAQVREAMVSRFRCELQRRTLLSLASSRLKVICWFVSIREIVKSRPGGIMVGEERIAGGCTRTSAIFLPTAKEYSLGLSSCNALRD